MNTTQSPFEVMVQGLCLRGTCHVPAGSGPFPTAVLFHGFGANRMEISGAFVVLARKLAASGIAVLAYDRAGHGESDGAFFDTSVSGDVAHAREVLEAVCRLPFVDARSVHLVGMSLGAIVAAVLAAETSVPVCSLTLWSSAGIFVDEIRGGLLQGRSLATLDTLGYFDFLGQRLGPAMRDDARGFDLYGRVSPYRQPVLLLHGDADFVPVLYAQRLRDAFGGAATLEIVRGADHGWAQVPHREMVIAQTVRFITARAGRPRP
jgi:uncharacterized protein